MRYIGQTDRSFHKSYQEHFHDFKYNIHKSRFVTHQLESKHSIGPINEVMEIFYMTSKGRFMDTPEKYYIYIVKHATIIKLTIRTQSSPTPFFT